MIAHNQEAQSLLANILANIDTPLPTELVSGRLCGLVCEVCPLRPWKSPGITAISCQQLLVVVSPRPQRDSWRARLKTLFRTEIPGSHIEMQRHDTEYPGINR